MKFFLFSEVRFQWVWFIFEWLQMYCIYCVGGTFILSILTMRNETKPWPYLHAVSCFRRILYPDRTRFFHLDTCCRLDRTCGINYNAQLLGFPSGITASVHSNVAQSKHHAAFSPWDYRLCFHSFCPRRHLIHPQLAGSPVRFSLFIFLRFVSISHFFCFSFRTVKVSWLLQVMVE